MCFIYCLLNFLVKVTWTHDVRTGLEDSSRAKALGPNQNKNAQI
jgi:hypothetical protein